MIGGHSTDYVLKKLVDQIETGELMERRPEKPPVSAPSPTATEVKRTEMQERKKLIMMPLADVGALSYRVNRTAITAAVKDSEAVPEAVLIPPKEEVESNKKSWRAEITDLKMLLGVSLSSLVAASTDRTRTEAGQANLQISSLTQGVLSDDPKAEFAIPAKARPRADFTKPVKPRSRSERAAKFAAHGIILRKSVLPWKATPSRPLKFSLLDPDALTEHPGLVDGGDPWCSVFWASKAGDIHAGCHYRPIIL